MSDLCRETTSSQRARVLLYSMLQRRNLGLCGEAVVSLQGSDTALTSRFYRSAIGKAGDLCKETAASIF